jgi:hypothetical protein
MSHTRAFEDKRKVRRFFPDQRNGWVKIWSLGVTALPLRLRRVLGNAAPMIPCPQIGCLGRNGYVHVAGDFLASHAVGSSSSSAAQSERHP